MKEKIKKSFTLTSILVLAFIVLQSNLSVLSADVKKHCRITKKRTITRYANSFATNINTDIITGSDGNLWFITAGNIVAKITPQGSIANYRILPPSDNIHSLTFGPDGNLWFTVSTFLINSKGKIFKLTPEGDATEYIIPSIGYATSITTGPDGNLWFTESNSKIGKITTDGAITEYDVSEIPYSIIAGPDGSMWFTEGDFSGLRIEGV